MTELDKLLRELAQPGVALELAVLVGCLGLAFAICWAVGRRQPKDSIWFGRAIFDGVLFPLLALVLTWIARRIVDDYQVVPVLRIAVPVLVSLVGIRFLARVTTVVFPASGIARLVERRRVDLRAAAGRLPRLHARRHRKFRQRVGDDARRRRGRSRRAGAGRSLTPRISAFTSPSP